MLYLCFIVSLASLFLGFHIWYAVAFWQGNYFWIYLTHWSLTVETLYLIFMALAAFVARRKLDETSKATEGATEDADGTGVGQEPAAMPVLHGITLTLFTIATPLSLIVTVLYWTLVYSPNQSVSWTTYIVHLLNFILLLVNFSVSRLPIYFANSLPYYLFGFSYIIWSLIDWGATIGTNDPCDNYSDVNQCPIYGVLDWNYPRTAAVVAVGVVVIALPISTGVFWLLARVRSRIVLGSWTVTAKAADSAEDPGAEGMQSEMVGKSTQ